MTLEDALRRAFASGVRSVSVVNTEIGFQANLNRKGETGYTVNVEPDVVTALLAVLNSVKPPEEPTTDAGVFG